MLLYGKELKGDQITGEYVGVARINQSFLPVFCKQMEQMILHQEHGVWWENVLYSLSGQTDILVRDVQGQFWAEVDYIEDYQRIMKFVQAGK